MNNNTTTVPHRLQE